MFEDGVKKGGSGGGGGIPALSGALIGAIVAGAVVIWSVMGFYQVDQQERSVISTFRRQLQASNDNLGMDVAAFSGVVVVRSTPLIWVPALDNTESEAYDATNPIYGVNWKKFRYFFKSGRNMLKLPPKPAARQSMVRAVLIGSLDPVPAPKAAKACNSLPKLRPPIKKSSCRLIFSIEISPIAAMTAK